MPNPVPPHLRPNRITEPEYDPSEATVEYLVDIVEDDEVEEEDAPSPKPTMVTMSDHEVSESIRKLYESMRVKMTSWTSPLLETMRKEAAMTLAEQRIALDAGVRDTGWQEPTWSNAGVRPAPIKWGGTAAYYDITTRKATVSEPERPKSEFYRNPFVKETP